MALIYPEQTQSTGAIAGSRILAAAACQTQQAARDKEVPTKLNQLRCWIENLESAAGTLTDAIQPVMGPQHPEPVREKLAGGNTCEASMLGSELESLRARVQEVTNRLQSAHGRLEV